VALPFLKLLLHSGARAVGTETLNTGPNILTDILNTQPELTVCDILRTRFGVAKITSKVKKNGGFWLGVKKET
jgi:hypothetical protein